MATNALSRMITGSESGIRETRAAQASEAIRIHQEALINSHKIELSRLKAPGQSVAIKAAIGQWHLTKGKVAGP